jgi:hypothetical protein
VADYLTLRFEVKKAHFFLSHTFPCSPGCPGCTFALLMFFQSFEEFGAHTGQLMHPICHSYIVILRAIAVIIVRVYP